MPDTAQLPSSSKRRKLLEKESIAAKPSRVPQIFAPFRAIGIVANHVAPAIQPRGKAYLVTTCVGKSVQTYDVNDFCNICLTIVYETEFVVRDW